MNAHRCGLRSQSQDGLDSSVNGSHETIIYIYFNNNSILWMNRDIDGNIFNQVDGCN